MGPLAHDFNRTIRSKSLLLSVGVVVLLSFSLIPLVKLSTSPIVFGGGQTMVFGYYSSPDYHLLGYSFNAYGQPVQGSQFNITISDPSGVHKSIGTTNSSGYASMVFAGSPPGGTTTYVLHSGQFSTGQGDLPVPAVTGGVFILLGSPVSFVQDPSNSSRLEALFVYMGTNGSVPSDYTLYYNFTSSQGTSGNPDPSTMHVLGVPGSFATTWKLPPFPADKNNLIVAAFSTTGAISTIASYTTQNSGGYTPPTPEQLFTEFTSGILALVVPLMAILVAYNSYGKDRTTGVIESVIARPVTRRGIGLTRYVSLVVALSVALIAMMGVMEVISQLLLGSALSFTFAAYTVASLIVEATAFVGITLFISHLLKSSGSLVGVGIVVWVVLDFFWGTLILVAALAFGIQIGSGNYLGLSIQSSFFNPAQFYSLVGEFLNGISITSAFGSNVPISPATYGLTPVTLVLDAALWVLLPLAAFLYLVVRRD